MLKKYEDSTFGRLFDYASDKKCVFFCGMLVSMANGTIFPIFSIFIAGMLSTLISFNDTTASQAQLDQARSDANIFALIFFVIAIGAFIINLLQQTIFTNIG